jgi:AcrR family transcriptional regulator
LARRQRSRVEVVPRSQVVEIQRLRVMAAATRAVDELGYAETSVSSIVARARVSRRTFYEMFANRDECLAAVLEDALARIELELERTGVGGLVWRERLRVGLWVILSFLERERVLARVCVVHALAGGPAVCVQREQALARLAVVVDEGRREGRGGEPARLMAEGLVGAAYMIIYARLHEGRSEPLTGLLGELMGLLVLAYLGPAAARREQARPAPRVPAVEPGGEGSRAGSAGDVLQGVAMRLTYRTVRVLESVREYPGASNRQVADRAGIGDAGQVSKLLRRLERLGLLENRGGGHAHGEPNAWWLSAKGTDVARSVCHHSHEHGQQVA